MALPRIIESLFEHKLLYTEPWVDRWGSPNPFLVSLTKCLKHLGVGLSDFSFHNDTPTIADACLNIEIRRLHSAVRIGLDSISLIAMNPAWEFSPEVISAFGLVCDGASGVIGVSPASQESTLSFHITPGGSDFRSATNSLIAKTIANDAVSSRTPDFGSPR